MMAVIIHYGFLALIVAFAVAAWVEQIKDERNWRRGWSDNQGGESK